MMSLREINRQTEKHPLIFQKPQNKKATQLGGFLYQGNLRLLIFFF
jgi:hypothetical protein